jgi:hypothetical protein
MSGIAKKLGLDEPAKGKQNADYRELTLARKNHAFYEATRLLRARSLFNGRFAPV